MHSILDYLPVELIINSVFFISLFFMKLKISDKGIMLGVFFLIEILTLSLLLSYKINDILASLLLILPFITAIITYKRLRIIYEK